MIAALVSSVLDHAHTVILLIVTGVLGLWLHIRADLTTGNVIVIERFLRGAPILAPLFYTDMGLLGLLVLIDLPER